MTFNLNCSVKLNILYQIFVFLRFPMLVVLLVVLIETNIGGIVVMDDNLNAAIVASGQSSTPNIQNGVGEAQNNKSNIFIMFTGVSVV